MDAKRVPGTKCCHSHASVGGSSHCRDFSGREALEVEECQESTVTGLELGERVVNEQSRGRGIFELFVAGKSVDECTVVDRESSPLPVVDQQIAGDRQEPRRLGTAAEAVQVSCHPDERLLGEVGGEFSIAAAPCQISEHGRAVSDEEPLYRIRRSHRRIVGSVPDPRLRRRAVLERRAAHPPRPPFHDCGDDGLT